MKLLIAFISIMSFAEIVDSIDQFKWKNRLIVIRQDSERVQKQEAEFRDQDGFNERFMKVVQLKSDHEFFENYSNSHFFLVGKDGIVKAHSAMPMGQNYLFNIIDAMPMRKVEIEEQKAKQKKN